MKNIHTLICATLLLISSSIFAQQSNSKVTQKNKIETCLNNQLDNFTNVCKGAASDASRKNALETFYMTEDDVNYWLSQFEFTEEVMKQMSPETFKAQLTNYGTEAQADLEALLGLADDIKLGKIAYQTDDNPKLKVNRFANATLEVLVNNKTAARVQLTFIDIQGHIKLLKIN